MVKAFLARMPGNEPACLGWPTATLKSASTMLQTVDTVEDAVEDTFEDAAIAFQKA